MPESKPLSTRHLTQFPADTFQVRSFISRQQVRNLGALYFRDGGLGQAHRETRGRPGRACPRALSSLPTGANEASGLLTAFPSSKTASANLHSLNGEVTFRVHFQRPRFPCAVNYTEVLCIPRAPALGLPAELSGRARQQGAHKAASFRLRGPSACTASVTPQPVSQRRGRAAQTPVTRPPSLSLSGGAQPLKPQGRGGGLNMQFQTCVFECVCMCV